MTFVERLEEMIDGLWEVGQEVEVEMSVQSECAWSGTLRYTPNPSHAHSPDRSLVLFAVGCRDPEHVIERLLEEFDLVLKQDWPQL